MPQFYFAWTDPDETTFGPEHEVEDEVIVRFTMEQNEGDFAELSIDFKNPRVGPLAASRKVWAWFSYQSDSEVVPIGFFRLVAIPSNILDEVVTYKLIARPGDFIEQKAALADTLRVLPFYDELFIDAGHQDDPDVVLEGYTRVWDIDRVSHVVTTTDFLVGEDGVEVFDDTDTIDGVQVTIDRVPLTSVTINGEVPWTQTFGGTIQIGRKVFTSLAEPDNWPKAGDALAGGYYVISSEVETSPPVETQTIQFNYTNREEKHRDGDVMSVNESKTDIPGNRPGAGLHLMLTNYSYSVTGDSHTGTPASAGHEETGLVIPEGWFASSMTLGIDASGGRMDAVSIVVTSDLQPVLKDPGDTSDTEIIDLGTSEVSEGCESDGTPIVDSRRSEYVSTDRGLSSIQYMINRARARLIIGARVVTVSWECHFERALNLSCRKNAQIVWDGLPGEAVIGKVVSYSLRGDGMTGEFRGAVKIACAVGLGNAITTSNGVGDYVDEDYVDDYQTFTGQVVALPSGDIGYSPPVRVSSSGGMPFRLTADDLVLRDEIVGSPVDQQAAVLNQYRPQPIAGITPHGMLGQIEQQLREAQANMARALAATQTWREIELVDLTSQNMESKWTVATTPLVIPRQIDLTADVSA